MSRRGKVPKEERAKIIEAFWKQPVHPELEVVDRGDHLKITACSKNACTWWTGTLRVVYPQDHYSTSKKSDVMKMHPEPGVSLQLNRNDGTLKVRGRRHLQWFQENFRSVVSAGNQAYAESAERTRLTDVILRLDDGITVSELLKHIPATGAIRHGPSFIYRLWRDLLDKWIGLGGKVYIVSPLLDAERLSEIIIMLCKHRSSTSVVQIFTMLRCDGETKFLKVLEEAQKIVRAFKGPNKKQFITEERIQFSLRKIDVKYGKFHCKLIATRQDENAEVLVTSANFHKWHFETESRDTINHFRLTRTDLMVQYIAPLGLEKPASNADVDSLSSSPSCNELPADTGPVPDAGPVPDVTRPACTVVPEDDVINSETVNKYKIHNRTASRTPTASKVFSFNV